MNGQTAAKRNIMRTTNHNLKGADLNLKNFEENQIAKNKTRVSLIIERNVNGVRSNTVIEEIIQKINLPKYWPKNVLAGWLRKSDSFQASFIWPLKF